MSDGFSAPPPPVPSRTKYTILQMLMLASFIGAAGVAAGLCRYGLRDQANTAFLLAGLMGVVIVLALRPSADLDVDAAGPSALLAHAG